MHEAALPTGPDIGAIAPLGRAELAMPAHLAAWRQLARTASEPNPFYESWFLLPALELLDPQGSVRVLGFFHQGRLAGLLPLRSEQRYYGYPLPHWRNWAHANCFLGLPLVERGLERAFWRALLDWCDRRAGAALFLHLLHCPQAGPLHDALEQELRCQQRSAATVWRQQRAMLASQLSPQDYLVASLSGRKRKELRRQHRRLSESGDLRLERLGTDEGIAEWIDAFLALERAGWKGAAGSAMASDPRNAELLRRTLHGAAVQGRLERLALRLDGAPVAMLATFLAPPGAFSFKTAYDEKLARFSPGVLLQCENLALLERPDLTFVDSCAASDHPMIDHLWRERRCIARHNIAIGGAARRALFKALLRCETGRHPGGIA